MADLKQDQWVPLRPCFTSGDNDGGTKIEEAGERVIAELAAELASLSCGDGVVPPAAVRTLRDAALQSARGALGDADQATRAVISLLSDLAAQGWGIERNGSEVWIR